ncbi:e3 sumo-protein ligase 2-like protein [Moniliophthora roreri MCA 2997]|nr:e3 sumo-protein ligase 2-like protein [Moniliophthora roreri MCA 2997]
MANTLNPKAPEPRTTIQSTRQPLPVANGPPPSSSSQKAAAQNLFNDPVSPAEGIDIVTSFLESRRDQPISSIEAEGLISLLKKSAPVESREPFRFSSSTPSTPLRGNSPLFTSTSTNNASFRFTAPTESPNISQSSETPAPRLLKHNPNGTYRWQGGGSAKPSRNRNRYQLPSFGSQRSSQRLVLKDSPEKAAKTDTKRRRVGDELHTSSALPSGSTSSPPPQMNRSPAPAPSPTRTVQAGPFPASSNGLPNSSSEKRINGASTSFPSSRSRLSVPQKPTTPAVPSPLRQAWGQSSPSTSSDGEGSPIPQSQRQTKAANFVSELINQVTPTRYLDVSNPYQVASPVKTTGAPKQRSRRIRASDKKQEVNGSDAVTKIDKEKEKEKKEESTKQYTAQAIIEATVPKGSTRSRPPANIGNGGTNGIASTRSPSPSDTRKSPRKTALDVSPGIEEIEDSEQPPTKKAKANGAVNGLSVQPSAPSAAKSGPTIEEVSDEDETVAAKQAIKPSEVVEADNNAKPIVPQSTSNPFGLTTTTNNKSSLPVIGVPKTSTIPREPSKLRQSFKLDSTPTPSPAPTPSAPLPGFTAASLPDNSATSIDSAMSSKTTDPKQAALAVPLPSLPSFTFTIPTTVSLADASNDAMAKAKIASRASLPRFEFSAPAETIKPSKPAQSFDFAAAGMKPVAAPTGGAWICSTCKLKNDSPAATKCAVCDEPRQQPSVKPVAQGFDWAAAGMKPKPAPAEGSWTCSTCQLRNDNPMATKCAFCDESRQPPPTKPVVQGFDWAAAGMKPKPAPAAGSWVCSTCTLENTDSAATKCKVCDTPR